MSQEQQPKLSPPGAIQRSTLLATVDDWFSYRVRVQPHRTDFSGTAWHGSYIAWMEEARVECLHSVGISFADLVALGCDLPVVDLSIRYHQSVRLGMELVVKTRLSDITGVRVNWDYQIQSPNEQVLYATARVTLVTIDREKGKIMRQLPPTVKDAMTRLLEGFARSSYRMASD